MHPAHSHKPAHARSVGGVRSRARGHGPRNGAIAIGVLVVLGAGGTLGVLHVRAGHAAVRGVSRTTTTTALPTTTTTITASTTTTLATVGSTVACTPVAVAGGSYAVGDSVMIDAQQELQGCVPGIQVNAAVSRQWSDGETILRSVMAGASPPSVVVVALGTNGPITSADFDAMMSILHGASHVVFVTVHVGRSWQDQVNSVLASGVARYPKTVLADWESRGRAAPRVVLRRRHPSPHQRDRCASARCAHRLQGDCSRQVSLPARGCRQWASARQRKK